jgi:hypothetical protein
LQSLRRQFLTQLGNTCDIAARPVKIIDQTQPYRIASRFENDRNGRARRFCRESRWSACCGNHSDLTTHQIGHHRRQLIASAIRPMIFDCDVAAIDVTGLTQSLEKTR